MCVICLALLLFCVWVTVLRLMVCLCRTGAAGLTFLTLNSRGAEIWCKVSTWLYACENVSDRVSGATVWVNARISLPTRELLLVTQFPSPSGYQAHYRYTHGWPGGKHHEESALVGGGLPEHLSCPGQQQLNSFPWSMVFWAMTAICILIFVPQFYLFLCTTSLLQVLGHHLICRLVYEFLGSCLCLSTYLRILDHRFIRSLIFEPQLWFAPQFFFSGDE